MAMAEPAQPEASFPDGSAPRRRRERRRRRTNRTPPLHKLADQATEGLIYGMVVFTPWAFGTTQEWAIWTMNGAAYLLGALLVLKWIVRWKTGYTPARWDAPPAVGRTDHREPDADVPGGQGTRWPTRGLAVLTLLLLGWVLVSALNARATLDLRTLEIAYRDNYVAWLPHSYHAPATWFAFWKYLGLACAFWALRDWLLGMTRRERHDFQNNPPLTFNDTLTRPSGALSHPMEEGRGEGAVPVLPARLKRLLWVLCLNGALLAFEGMLQRFSGTNRLLWLVEPAINKPALAQFGPYAYRSNAAQYLNLIWPVCLGLWWMLRAQRRLDPDRVQRAGDSPHVVLLPCAALIAAAPVVSTSRGGALITLATLPLAALILVVGQRRHRSKATVAIMAVAAAALTLGIVLGWPALRERLYAPRKTHRLTGPGALQDFTLRCQLTVPGTPPGRWTLVASLSREPTGWWYEPSSFGIFLRADGSLHAIFYGREKGMLARRTVRQFTSNYADQPVDLVVTRHAQGLELYANGVRLEAVASGNTPSLVTNRIGAVHFSLDPEISPLAAPGARVTLLDRALTPDQLAATAQASSDTTPSAPDAAVPSPLFDSTGDALGSPSLLLDQLSGRDKIYVVARQMAEEYPWLGSGPATFGPLFGLYRPSPSAAWVWYVHNDWLETRISFGRAGTVLVLCALALVFVAPLTRRGAPASAVFVALIWLALVGCLVHARLDFPLQIYSILFVFLVLSCLSFSATLRSHGR